MRATLPRRLVAASSAALAWLLCSCGTGDRAANGWNVVLVVIDTLRADRVSSYGYSRATTPGLDALAAGGVRFANASSTSSWTLPAHASMFTGLYPIEHGATQEHTLLGEEQTTLAEILGARGYATFAASGNGVVNRSSGLTRGFERVAENWRTRQGASPPAPSKHPNLLSLRDFLAEVGEQPFFAFVNYVEVHAPYDPPEPHRSRFLAKQSGSRAGEAARLSAAAHYLDPAAISSEDFAVLSDLYDGEVAYADALVSALVDEVRKAGQLDRTLLLITSDHGENLGDHGHYRHVFSLYDTTVRIPLIARLPAGARAGEVIEEPVSLVDLFATILAAANAGDAIEGRGRDLFAADFAAAPVFAEYYFPLQALQLFDPRTRAENVVALDPHLRRIRSVSAGDRRLIWSSDGRHELYAPAADPGEQRNLVDVEAATAVELQRLVESFVARAGGERPLPDSTDPPAGVGAFGDLDDETAAELRELGYLRE